MQSRRWCLTLNNPENYCTDGKDITVQEIFAWIVKTQENTGLRYAIFQLEQGSEGTPHIQAYCEFGRPVRLSFVVKLIPGHWEAARKAREACIRYCSKEETRISGPWEFGDSELKQGERTDIMQCKRMLDDNCTDKEISDTCFRPWAKYHKAFKEYRRIQSPTRDFKTQVYVFWGSTGTGKTRLCKLIADAGSVYWLAPNSHWFDDYEEQETVIFDDFYGTIPYSSMLRIMDRTELRLESKGGHVNFVAKRLLITSNKQPAEWYDGTKYPLDALRRRIDHELYFLCDNQRTVIKGPALPIFFTGWGQQVRLVDEIGDTLSAETAEDEMRKHFEDTQLTTWDCGSNECDYSTEEWEYDNLYADVNQVDGKQNVVDLTESESDQ